ncbi:glycoside hydrolase family 3 protein [Parvularcula lutaonensis]|uniref:Glycoside hydrolase family 3 N-terminal domain-containing protein n=1 Tax=Parvularcula lutaonensis TaxID=491923 RepID=A0ABV7MCF0_9PROT|nr:glycoside hydrolase family 3 protein [Parvularcula lutaonensis]GGY48797.1 glucan 1,4-beta-glucosidase [Parvularcula lutaonensis]
MTNSARIPLRSTILVLMAYAAATGCTEKAALADEPAESSLATIHPERWPAVTPPSLDPEIEARVDEILARMTLEQKVGQVIQADSASVTPEDIKRYRLGSVLSGGNSAPGPLPYADTQTWLEAADAYYEASIDPEGVEIAIPIIWGIDAVHGHANLKGATVFPHNIGLGAANDPDLIEAIAAATAKELTVSGHDWTFAPTLAVPQNDRWGRTYEGFSEDPRIVASYGGRIVIGLQGTVGERGFMGPGKVIPSAKHFVGDGGTDDGIDQGDALITEEELRDIHAAGYVTAIEAGAQSVMASFSAWNGQRMHGQKALLTDVLKGQMGFNGFVVGDWNGHALIPGCSTTDCPQSLNAGLDMYMAPDSWRGLYESTLRHAKSSTIPMERLDDAVRRILRVKIASGLFEKPKPSERPFAGDTSILGSPEHKALARKAVRQSLVLLKNNGLVLPLDPGLTVLVVGDGADSISKASGGWTLSWQGGGFPNSEFPGGQSILDGIREVVTSAGGAVIHDPEGTSGADADVVIAVYGEDPYAEFQGDRPHVDFTPNGFDTGLLAELGRDGTPIVSVFLSGRPLWTNPEINASDAFVAAWLPGSQGGGVADLLFQTDPNYDFTGRLSFSWPALATDEEVNVTDPSSRPLFPVGYGLSYGQLTEFTKLSEESGLDDEVMAAKGEFFTRGEARQPWSLNTGSGFIGDLPYADDRVVVRAVDESAQEDSLAVSFREPETFSIRSSYPVDFSRESNGAMELVFSAKSMTGSERADVGMGCQDNGCEASLPLSLGSEWSEHRLALSCFAQRGVDMARLDRALIIKGQPGQEIAVGNIRVEADDNGQPDCGSS